MATMPTTARSRPGAVLAAILLAAGVVPGCTVPAGPPGPPADPCAAWAPEARPPTEPRTAPEGWPAPPPGDVACGSTFTGDELRGVERVLVVTERAMDEVLEHYEGALPGSLPVERIGLDGEESLHGELPGIEYSVEPAGEHRYALVFRTFPDA